MTRCCVLFLALLLGTVTAARAAESRGEAGEFTTFTLATPVGSAAGPAETPYLQPMAVADTPLDDVEKISRMEPQRLLFVGVGVVAGAAFLAPSLGMSELLGVAIGVIAAEYVYRTFFGPPRSWWW